MSDVCGTMRGYRRHNRRHEPVCQPCRQAHIDYCRDRRRRLTPGTPVILLPLPPLVRYLEADDTHAADLAELLGTHRSAVYRWFRDGIPIHSADAICCRHGIHLLNLWPDAYDDIDTEEAA